jgi:hypothetical protein
MTASKFSFGGWSWKEANGVDLLLASLASQRVSTPLVAGGEMKLKVLICSWNFWLDRV